MEKLEPKHLFREKIRSTSIIYFDKLNWQQSLFRQKLNIKLHKSEATNFEFQNRIAVS